MHKLCLSGFLGVSNHGKRNANTRHPAQGTGGRVATRPRCKRTLEFLRVVQPRGLQRFLKLGVFPRVADDVIVGKDGVQGAHDAVGARVLPGGIGLGHAALGASAHEERAQFDPQPDLIIPLPARSRQGDADVFVLGSADIGGDRLTGKTRRIC